MANEVAEALRREAVAALNRRSWPQAQAAARRLLDLQPEDADGWFLLGMVLLEQRRALDALPHLHKAMALRPQRADYAAQTARALAAVSRVAEALRCADAALALQPEDPLTLDTLGVVFSLAHEHRRAVQAFRLAVRQRPDEPAYQFNLASSLKFLGEFTQAESAYDACLRLDPAFWKAYPARSQLRRQTPQSHHVDQLLARLDRAPDAEAQFQLRMALQKEYEDLGQEQAAFRQLSLAKALLRPSLRYHSDADARLFGAITRVTSAIAADRADIPGPRPIFVVGMPRTGTTLVERILSSHAQVRSAGETHNFGRSFKRASGVRSTELLDVPTAEAATGIDFTALGRDYVAATLPAADCAAFVDKLPLNFLYAGFIAAALPRARIVCLRRHPLDACLSNFRQLFAPSYRYYHYSFDLLDIARYYLLFDRLIEHWRRTLPSTVFLEMSYEALVQQQEQQTRSLLDFCGLGWDPACLQFERNAAPVATASAVQVRSPLYASSVGRWRRYEAELQPVRELLERGGVAVP